MHTYCVVLRPQQSLNSLYPHTKLHYIKGNSAAQAMLIASEDPEWRVFGVEPARHVCFPTRKRTFSVYREFDRCLGSPTR